MKTKIILSSLFLILSFSAKAKLSMFEKWSLNSKIKKIDCSKTSDSNINLQSVSRSLDRISDEVTFNSQLSKDAKKQIASETIYKINVVNECYKNNPDVMKTLAPKLSRIALHTRNQKDFEDIAWPRSLLEEMGRANNAANTNSMVISGSVTLESGGEVVEKIDLDDGDSNNGKTDCSGLFLSKTSTELHLKDLAERFRLNHKQGVGGKGKNFFHTKQHIDTIERCYIDDPEAMRMFAPYLEKIRELSKDDKFYKDIKWSKDLLKAMEEVEKAPKEDPKEITEEPSNSDSRVITQNPSQSVVKNVVTQDPNPTITNASNVVNGVVSSEGAPSSKGGSFNFDFEHTVKTDEQPEPEVEPKAESESVVELTVEPEVENVIEPTVISGSSSVKGVVSGIGEDSSGGSLNFNFEAASAGKTTNVENHPFADEEDPESETETSILDPSKGLEVDMTRVAVVECMDAVANYFADNTNKEMMDKFLQLQTKLTMHRLAWAYLENAKEKNGEVETIEQTIASLVNKMETEDPEVLKVRDQFNKSKMSRRAMADVMPMLQDVLASQSNDPDPEKKKFQIHEADIKILDLLSEKERERGDFNGTQRASRDSDQSVLNLLFIINSSYGHGAKLTGKDRERHKRVLDYQITKLQAEMNELISQIGTPEQCTDEALAALCPGEVVPQGDSIFQQLMQDNDKIVDAIHKGINSHDDDKFNRVRYGDVWLHTAF